MIDLLFYYKFSLLNTQLQKSSLLINSENLQHDHPPHLEREMRKKERTNY